MTDPALRIHLSPVGAWLRDGNPQPGAPLPTVRDFMAGALLALDTGLQGHPVRILAGQVHSFVFLEPHLTLEAARAELLRPRDLDGTGLRGCQLHALVEGQLEGLPVLWGLYEPLEPADDPPSRISILVVLAPLDAGLRVLMVEPRVAPRILVSPPHPIPELEQAHAAGAPFPDHLLGHPWDTPTYPGHPWLRPAGLPHTDRRRGVRPEWRDALYRLPTRLEPTPFLRRRHRWDEAPVPPTPRPQWEPPSRRPRPRTPDWLQDRTPGWLRDLTPADIQRGPGPFLRDLLRDAFFYPGPGLDVSPVRQLQGQVHSFIYAEWTEWPRFLEGLRAKVPGGEGFPGHRLVGCHAFRLGDLIAPEPGNRQVEPEARPAGERCLWAVYEATRPGFDGEAARFSFLFLESEALHAFRELFLAHRQAPVGMALIQHMGDFRPEGLRPFFTGEGALEPPRWIIRRRPYHVHYGSEYTFLPEAVAAQYREVAQQETPDITGGTPELRIILERCTAEAPWDC